MWSSATGLTFPVIGSNFSCLGGAARMAKEPINPGELEAELQQFIGTEQYYRHMGNVVLTDGTKYLAERAGAYWLMDIVASFQTEKKVACEHFQFWNLNVREDKKATVVADDGNGKVIARQEISRTNFPLRSQRLYLVNDGRYRVLMLPSEY